MAQTSNKSIHQGSLPQTSAPVPGQAQRGQVAGICLVLAAITFAVFSQTLHHEFVDFDDHEYVSDNHMVAQGLTLKGMVWAFSFHANNWHPLTWLSHMLDCQLYGLHPGGHHVTNVLLHIATVIALFLVLRQMTGALWRSAFVAAVFAIHPLRVESVAWVAERKDILSGLFFTLTVGAYVRFARLPWSWGRYGLVLLLFALGLMCKPMLVTLPLVLLLLDYWPLQRKEPMGKLALEKLPLLALSAAGCVATVLAQTGAIQSTASYSLPLRFANALVTCVVYLRQMVYPAGLALYYPYPNNGFPSWELALAGALLAGLSGVAFWQRRKQPWLLMGWVWYLVMLLPVVGIVQVGMQSHADRYTYLPQIGIYMAGTWWMAEWRVSRMAFGGLMAGVIAALMVCAWKQTAYWQNDEILWTRTLSCTSNNYVAQCNLANDLRDKGRVGEAIPHYQEALRVAPDYAPAHYALGNALLQEGKTDEGIAQLLNAVQLQPAFTPAQFNLGRALLQKGKIDEAITRFQNVLQIKPDDAPACYNLGKAFLQAGNVDEAIAYYQKAFEIKPDPDSKLFKPDYEEAHYNLGNALLQKGRMDEAVTQYQSALQLNPAYPDAHLNIGGIFLQNGKVDEAIAQFQQELQIAPASLQALNNLAWVLATCSNPALRNGRKAVELAGRANALAGGGSPIVLHILAASYAEAGQFGEARESVQKAIELARAAGQQDLAAQLNDELKRYEAGLPLHQ